jgi:hypothetical protein
MLNVEIRPFTTKWHGLSIRMDKIHFDEYYDLKFQEDLKQLQSDLAPYVAKFLETFNSYSSCFLSTLLLHFI